MKVEVAVLGFPFESALRFLRTLRHWSQFVRNMSTDIRGHEALLRQFLRRLAVFRLLYPSFPTVPFSLRHVHTSSLRESSNVAVLRFQFSSRYVPFARHLIPTQDRSSNISRPWAPRIRKLQFPLTENAKL